MEIFPSFFAGIPIRDKNIVVFGLDFALKSPRLFLGLFSATFSSGESKGEACSCSARTPFPRLGRRMEDRATRKEVQGL